MKHKNQTTHLLKHFLYTGLLSGGLLVSGGAQSATLAVDLTTASSGTIDDVQFIFDKTQPSGTGVLNPFLRIQENGNEQGYNTNNFQNVLDNKGPINFNHDLRFSNLVSDGGFYSFVLDIAEPVNGPGTASLLSLDGLKFFVGAGGQSSESVDANGNANGITGTLLWDMDALTDNYVLLDANRDGQPGNGVSDMLLKVPVSVFAGVNPTDNIILWSRFGLQADSTPGSGSFASFEEWAHLYVAPTPGTCADPAYAAANQDECGGGGQDVPEPSALALLGIGLLGMGASRKYRHVIAK